MSNIGLGRMDDIEEHDDECPSETTTVTTTTTTSSSSSMDFINIKSIDLQMDQRKNLYALSDILWEQADRLDQWRKDNINNVIIFVVLYVRETHTRTKKERNLINTELIHISIVENKQSIHLRTHLTDIFFPFVHLHP